MSGTDNQASYRDRVRQRFRIRGGKLQDEERKFLLERERIAYGLLQKEAEAILTEEERLYSDQQSVAPDAFNPTAAESTPLTSVTSTQAAVDPPTLSSQPSTQAVSASATPTPALPPEPPSSQSESQPSEPIIVPPVAHSPLTGPVLAEKDPRDMTTMLPPVSPEIYLANLHRYGDAYSQALDKGFLFDDDTKARLHQLARDLGLTRDDVTKTEQDILRQRFNPGNPRTIPGSLPDPPSDPDPDLVPDTDIVPPPPIPEDYKKKLNSVKKFLNNRRQWKQADEVTLDIILSLLYHGKSEKAEELDPTVLINFSPEPWQQEVMQELDRHWQAKGKFGFQRQLQIYHELTHSPDPEPSLELSLEEAVEFARRVLWWKAPLPGFGFLRFYDRLNFTPQAPAGHLPAWWFWKTTKWNNFKLGGLSLLPQRGGCRMDPALLSAFMNFLMKCGFTAQSTPASEPTREDAAEPGS